MESIAQLIPLPHRSPLPFTLGEAVAELGLWSGAARAESWRNRGNQESLDQDIATYFDSAGPRLRDFIRDLVPELVTSNDRRIISAQAAEFAKRWHEPEAIRAAYYDLCLAAASGSHGTWELKPMAEILASQLGEAHRSRSILSEASTALVGEPFPHQLKDWLGADKSLDDFTPAVRIETASNVLAAKPPTGHVVVWLLYRRAQVPPRLSAGPITFLRADWAIPNATIENGQDFEEREELKTLLEDQFAFNKDDLFKEQAAEESYVLVRVDMGQRSAGGAADEATRRVDALLYRRRSRGR